MLFAIPLHVLSDPSENENSDNTQENSQIPQKNTELPRINERPKDRIVRDYRGEDFYFDDPSFASLIVSYGSNFLRNNYPSQLNTYFWSSNFFDINLYYNIVLIKSHFALSPGIGMSWESYSFKPYGKEDKKDVFYTLVRDNDTVKDGGKYRNTKIEKSKAIFSEINKDYTINSSYFSTTYIDLMLDLRLSADKEYPKDSFFVTVGAKLGFLWSARTQVGYLQDNEYKYVLTGDPLNTKLVRYGWHTRVGWNRFGISYTMMLVDLFSKDRVSKDLETIKTHKVGISVDFF